MALTQTAPDPHHRPIQSLDPTGYPAGLLQDCCTRVLHTNNGKLAPFLVAEKKLSYLRMQAMYPTVLLLMIDWKFSFVDVNYVDGKSLNLDMARVSYKGSEATFDLEF